MYEVGNIVYIISNKQRQVIPAKIVEQVTRRTIGGEQVSYRVQLPSDSTQLRSVDLAAIDGTVHTSINEVRDLLYKQAMSAIDQVLESASSLRNASFGESQPVTVTEEVISAPVEFQPRQKKAASGKVKVRLPDGTSANVEMPDVQS